MKLKTYCLTFLLLLFCTTFTNAEHLTYDSLKGSSGKVEFTYSGKTEQAHIGEFQMTLSTNDIKAYGYCVQIDVPIFMNSIDGLGYYEFDTSRAPLLNLSTMADNGGYKAAWLINEWADMVSTPDEAVAMQLAVWEVIYGDNFEFTDTTTNAAVEDFYAKLIDSFKKGYDPATDPDKLHDMGYRVADLLRFDPNDPTRTMDAQNIIVRVVPEPGTMLLFGAGLLGLGALGRRKDV